MAYVDQRLLAFARSMRHESVPAEVRLWRCLRDRQLNSYKFRRQHPIGPFIADFCCVECRLIVELDGESHDDRTDYDARRTAELTKLGYAEIRFSNMDVFENIEGVLTDILEAIECLKESCPHPSPLP